MMSGSYDIASFQGLLRFFLLLRLKVTLKYNELLLDVSRFWKHLSFAKRSHTLERYQHNRRLIALNLYLTLSRWLCYDTNDEVYK